MPFFLRAFLLPFVLTPVASWAATPDPAPCLGALASIQAKGLENSWVGGALPRVVKYDPPHQDLAVWKRRDGTLLVLDGKGIQQIPSFQGPANGFTFIRDPGAVADRVLAPSVYRRVALADGRTFELHLLGEAGKEAVLLRGQAEDEAALAYEEDRQARKERAAHELFARHALSFERACEKAARRFSEQSLVEQLSSIFQGILRATEPGFQRSRADSGLRSEERFLHMDVEAIRLSRARLGLVEDWGRRLGAMAPERGKKENLLNPSVLSLTPEAASALLKEAAADFAKYTALEELEEEERAELKSCEGYLELPPAKEQPKKASLLEIGARSTLPPEYALLMKFYQRLQAEQDARLESSAGK